MFRVPLLPPSSTMVTVKLGEVSVLISGSISVMAFAAVSVHATRLSLSTIDAAMPATARREKAFSPMTLHVVAIWAT